MSKAFYYQALSQNGVKMSGIIYKTSIVVIADQHNPTILHPSFLKSEEIIPSSEGVSEDIICTPPFSMVKTTSGINFVAELNKLQLTDEQPPENISGSKIKNYALNYIRALPHVKYKAVGINYNYILPVDRHQDYVKERFLKRGNWFSDELNPSQVSLKLVYPTESSLIIRFSINSGQVSHSGNQYDGVIVDGNYHEDLVEDSAFKQLLSRIENFEGMVNDFKEKIEIILKGQ